MAVALKLCILDPKLVKPKCVWEAVDFFNFRKFVYIFELFVYNFSKKTTISQTHFGFTNLGSKMHRFRATAIYFWQFSIGTPCKRIFRQQLQQVKPGIPIRSWNLRMNKKDEINLYCCSSLHIQIVLTGM